MSRLRLVSFGASLLLLTGAAASWACTVYAQIHVTPGSGPAAEDVVIEGTQFGEGEVELRWDSATGPLLAVTEGPRFEVGVVIPQGASLGDHVIMAVQVGVDPMNEPSPQVGTADFARVPFFVTPKPEASGDKERSPERVDEGSGERNGAARHKSASAQDVGPAGAEGPGGAIGSGDRNSDRADSVRGGGVPARVVAVDGFGRVFRGSSPVSGTASEATLSGDLWGGFSAEAGASLLGGLSDPGTPAAGPGGELAIGIALLGLGVIALLGSLALDGAARRRRAVAGAHRERT